MPSSILLINDLESGFPTFRSFPSFCLFKEKFIVKGKLSKNQQTYFVGYFLKNIIIDYDFLRFFWFSCCCFFLSFIFFQLNFKIKQINNDCKSYSLFYYKYIFFKDETYYIHWWALKNPNQASRDDAEYILIVFKTEII